MQLFKIKYFILLLTVLFCYSCDSKAIKRQVGGFFGADLGERNYSPTIDSDQDGLSDLEEIDLGSDPNNPDSDGDGVVDGDEDSDGDGLSNAAEVALGYDPFQTTSNTSKYADLSPDLSVSDGDKDMDNDGIANWYEAKYDMNSLDPSDKDLDFDKDGFINSEEFPDYSPRSSNSFPGLPNYARGFDSDSNILGRTNGKTVDFTFSLCQEDESVAISLDGSSTPDASAFVTCNTEQRGISQELNFTSDQTYKVYIWRKVAGSLRPYPASIDLVYDTTGPSGSLKTTSFVRHLELWKTNVTLKI
ncbi:MAG: hypothetical protein R3B45_17515 [Bdellovibrionota bacterium]